MKMRKHRLKKKRQQMDDAETLRLFEAAQNAVRMAEQGLRPTPLEMEELFEWNFQGDTWETSWYFADRLLFLSITISSFTECPKFDIIVDDYEFATALVEIPIIADLKLSVTPVETLPREDSRYDGVPRDVPLWRVHSPDFQEHSDELYVMVLLTESEETEDGKQ